MRTLLVLMTTMLLLVASVAYAKSYIGGDGDDIMRGTKYADTFNSGKGHDNIVGRAGKDVAWCGPGHDYFDGGKNPRGKQDVGYNCEVVMRAIKK